jgi:glycosyltransferase involved in cell wall biosynthesis
MTERPHPDAARRARVAHFAARLPVGGMEMVVALLVRHAPAGYDSEVWCLEEPDHLGEELRAEGRHLEAFGRTARRQPGLFAEIGRRLRARRIDILHCHDELTWFYGTAGATFSPGTRVVFTAHGRRPAIAQRHLLEQRVLAWRTDAIVAVSAFIRTQLTAQLRLAPARVEVILNAIADAPGLRTESRRHEARRRLGLPVGALVAGTVGELSPVKNLDLALDAVSRARAALPALTFVVIGDGALAQALRDKAHALGIADIVTFAGLRRDVADLLPALDIYVCSSHYEGTSLAILEALQQSVPVVATAVGGNPQIVIDGETGLLVPAGDADVMAQALRRLGEDAALRDALGARAAAFVAEKFHVTSMTAAYDQVWRRVLPAGRRPAAAAVRADADQAERLTA